MRTCRVCGCTDDNACVIDAPLELVGVDGRHVALDVREVASMFDLDPAMLFAPVTCFWVEWDLCSACA